MFISFLYISLQNKFVVKMEFNEYGILNPGIHKMTWEEFSKTFNKSLRREILLIGLEKIYHILRNIGATHIYIDGSFVTNKLDPGDWDACFDAPEYVLYEIRELPNRKKIKELYGGDLFYVGSEADEYGTKYLDFFQQIRGSSVLKKGIVELID